MEDKQKKKSEEPWDPAFREQGIIYPAVWRMLTWYRFLSPSMWLPKKSATAMDLYLISWWAFEGICVLALSTWSGWRCWLLCALLMFRLIDMFFVHTSILIKGFYLRPTDWFSSSRIVLLTLLNAIELMFTYGILYWGLPQLSPVAAAVDPSLSGLYEGIYLSVTTATTLGYGTPNPSGWLTRLLAMLESAHLLLIVVAIIAYARSLGFRPVDRKLQDRAQAAETVQAEHDAAQDGESASAPSPPVS